MKKSAAAKAVFLDRDGVLNKPIVLKGKIYSPHKLAEFELLPGIGGAVARAKALGFLVIVVTNQPDLSRRLMTPADLEDMHGLLRREAPGIDDFFVCPHRQEEGCACRKPAPGMIREAAEKWGIDLAGSVLIGDTWKDVYAGAAGGCRTILIEPSGVPDAAFWDESAIRYQACAKDLAAALDVLESWALSGRA